MISGGLVVEGDGNSGSSFIRVAHSKVILNERSRRGYNGMEFTGFLLNWMAVHQDHLMATESRLSFTFYNLLLLDISTESSPPFPGSSPELQKPPLVTIYLFYGTFFWSILCANTCWSSPKGQGWLVGWRSVSVLWYYLLFQCRLSPLSLPRHRLPFVFVQQFLR